MNRKLIFLILLIFCSGMLLGSVSASHTYHKGKYSFTVSDSYYNKIEKSKTDYVGGFQWKDIKVNGVYKTVKVPKYKTKKVTKYKWQYKKVIWEYITWYPYKGVKVANMKDYYKNGWVKHSSGSCNLKNNKKYGAYNYVVVKKRVPYKASVKVKDGYTNKKVKWYARVFMENKDEPYVCYGYFKNYDFINVSPWYNL